MKKIKLFLGLIGNKLDLIEDMVVEKKDGEKYANEICAYFGEMSAKENRKVFKNFIHKLLEKLLLNEDSIEKEGNIFEINNDNAKKKTDREREKLLLKIKL